SSLSRRLRSRSRQIASCASTPSGGPLGETKLRGCRMQFEDHPTVRSLATKPPGLCTPEVPAMLDAALLRHIAVEHGADDVGIVEIGRPAIEPQRAEILRNYPWTKSLLSFVVKMAREPIRGAPRSVANLEFHRAGDEVDHLAAAIVAELEERGIRAVNPSMGFPMEMYQANAGAIWVVSHKP